jgi:hypothetical protein
MLLIKKTTDQSKWLCDGFDITMRLKVANLVCFDLRLGD